MSTEVLEFRTNSLMPVEAFTVMGMSSKPNSENPIGEFGTGLKLALAAILRMGGTFKLYIGGEEYVFYTSTKTFRGDLHEQVMMRKRRGVLSRWQYSKLPFTLNYGRNLSPWQCYRELESNTRDEGGTSGWVDEEMPCQPHETVIYVTCPGMQEAVEKSDVFLQDDLPLAWKGPFFNVYDAPSQSLYYRGVRVFDLKHPSRFTYDFKPGQIKLTEDRTPKDVWYAMHQIQYGWMAHKIDKAIIYKALNYNDDKDEPRFETHELIFDPTSAIVTDTFVSVAKQLNKKGFTSSKIGSWSSGYYSHTKKAAERKAALNLTQDDIRVLVHALESTSDFDDADEIKAAELLRTLKTHLDVPF